MGRSTDVTDGVPVPPAETVSDSATTGGVRPRQVSGLVGHPVVGALSPSRASDFLTCPLLYRFRAIDRLPERPGLAAFRGTLVHEVLDRLFELPAGGRDLQTAVDLAPQALDELLDHDPEFAFAMIEDALWPADEPPEVPDEAREKLLTQVAALLGSYFAMEDPREIEPLHREQLVETSLGEDFLLRGYVDRIDETEAGLRVIDYKTGRSPSEMWEQSAMFQLRFYALVLQRATGRIPAQLQLLYLGNGEVLSYEPDEDDLKRFERKLHALWTAITRAAQTGDWRPRRSGKCSWCSHQQLCPEFGGTPPPLPSAATNDTSTTVVT